MFLLVSISSSVIFAQELSDINVGIGITDIINTETNTASSNVGGYGFMVEKPIKIIGKKSNLLSFHPGINYTEINENSATSGLGHHNEYKILASSASIYSKFLINSKIKTKNEITFYTGAIIGTYFWSQIDNKENSNIKYYKNGKSFFHSGFWGLLVGIRSNLSETVKFMPAIEISYYPNYVDLNIGPKMLLTYLYCLVLAQKKPLNLSSFFLYRFSF